MGWPTAVATIGSSLLSGLFGGDGDDEAKKLRKLYEQAMRKAELNNLRRYQQGLSEWSGLYDRAMGYLAQDSGQRRADVTTAAREQAARGMSRLADQGLNRGTIAETERRGWSQYLQAELNRLNDAEAQRKLEWDARITQGKTNFIAARSDPYPSRNDYMPASPSVPFDWSGLGRGVGDLLTDIFRQRRQTVTV